MPGLHLALLLVLVLHLVPAHPLRQALAPIQRTLLRTRTQAQTLARLLPMPVQGLLGKILRLKPVGNKA
jgi:hypothetical protein